MKRLTDFIVNKRIVILAVMLILTAVSIFLIPKVGVNSDMTKYLPDDSPMRQGISLMEKEFPKEEAVYTIRVMFKGLNSGEKTEIKDALAAIENVDSVTYDRDSSDYNSGEYTLYILNTGYGYDTGEEADIEKQAAKKFSGYEVTVKNDDTSAPDIPFSVYLTAFGIILVVLLISCGSYFEPVLFLVTIGIAVVLNLGTGFLQYGTKTVYTLSGKDPIADVFPKDNTVVLLYENADEDMAAEIVPVLEGKDGVKSVVSYPTTTGRQCTAKEMSEMLSETGGDLQADEKLLNIVYYHFHKSGRTEPVTLSDFIGFLSDTAAADPLFSGYIDEASAEQLAALKPLTEKNALTAPLPAEALAQALGMDAGQVTRIFMLRYGAEYTPDKALSLYEFVSFLTERVLPDPEYSALFDDASKAKLYQTKTVADAVVSGREFTPEEMAELLGGISDKFSVSAVELLCLYCASLGQENAQVTMTPETFVGYIDKLASEEPFSSLLTAEQKDGIARAEKLIADGARQLRGDKYSRLTVTTVLPVESEKTSAFVREMAGICDEKLSGRHYLIGNSVMVNEMESGFSRELLLITLLTAVSVFIVVALTFRSLAVPAILVLIVQCGVFITVSALGAIGGSMYYLALLIVECILMGATIDYGILFTSYYREMRAALSVKEAIAAAYKGSIHTILTSGTIMVLITAVIGPLFGNPTIGQIVRTLAVGCTSAVFLILFVLPGILALCDRFAVGKRRTGNK